MAGNRPDEDPHYTKKDPPPSCYDCYWHKFTYSPSTGCRSIWNDYCGNTQEKFGKLHIILRGEYRALAKHDEDDLKKTLPFECPYFDEFRLFWEMYGRIKMDYEIFIYDTFYHGDYYKGFYVYSFSGIINRVKNECAKGLDLHYLVVDEKDRFWFVSNFGERSVMLSGISPYDWHYHVPVSPV